MGVPKKKKASTRLNDCPSKFYSKIQSDSSWVLEERKNAYNHEPSKDILNTLLVAS